MLEETAWGGSGDEKELASEFCQDVSLFKPPTPELAAGEEEETPGRAVECVALLSGTWGTPGGSRGGARLPSSGAGVSFLPRAEKRGVGLQGKRR